MLTHKVDIERPAYLALLLAAALVSFGWAQWSLNQLGAAQAQAPVLIVHDRDALIAALQDAPFAGPAGEDGRPLGDPVWLIAHVGCEGCDAATAQALARLDRAGLTAQVLFAPDTYPAAPETAALIATVARTGEAAHFQTWRDGQPLPPVITDPAEAEGYGELARQSAERLAAVLAANGLDAALPVLIWRDEGSWRALPAGRPAAAAAIQRDLQS